MKELYRKDNLRLLVGCVAQDVRFTEKNGERMAVVRLADSDGDKVDVFFKNDMSVPERPKKMADRIENAKVGKDKWLSVLVKMEDGAPTASGLNFKYDGIWTFDQGKNENGEDRPKANVIVGYSTRPERVSESLFRVSMAERTYDRDTKTKGTRWYSIAFFDDEKNLNAKNAEKLLSLPEGQNSILCAIRCSSVRENVVETKEGEKTFYNLTGYQIERMLSDEAAVSEPATAAA